MQIVLLSCDLMIVSRVGGAVDRRDFTLTTTGNAEDALAACGKESTALLIVDLQIGNLDLSSLAQNSRQSCIPTPTVIAFGSHVHEARLDAARAAGCDLVLSRGQFDRELNRLLEGLVE